MKKNASLSINELTIRSDKWLLLLFVLIGTVFIIVGILHVSRIEKIDDLLIGIGVLFTSGGLFFFINARDYRIVIDTDSEKIILHDLQEKKSGIIEIPIHYYASIMILRKISSDSGSRKSSRYEIFLMSDMGSTLLLSDFADIEKAISFGKELQSILKIDLLFEDDSIQRLLSKKQFPAMVMQMDIPATRRINKVINNSATTLTWNCRYAILSYILLPLILIGFFYIIHFSLIPSTGNAFAAYIVYGFVFAILLIVISIIIMNAVGTYYLTVSSSGINYYVSICGKKIGERLMNAADIGMLKNSISNQEATIQIISVKGLGAMRNILKNVDGNKLSSPDFSMIGDFLSIKNEIIDINVSSFSMKEKMYIENVILQSIRKSV